MTDHRILRIGTSIDNGEWRTDEVRRYVALHVQYLLLHSRASRDGAILIARGRARFAPVIKLLHRLTETMHEDRSLDPLGAICYK